MIFTDYFWLTDLISSENKLGLTRSCGMLTGVYRAQIVDTTGWLWDMGWSNIASCGICFWLVVTGTMEFYDFPYSGNFHHPNWRIHIFQRGWNQYVGNFHHPNWRTHIFQKGRAKNHQPGLMGKQSIHAQTCCKRISQRYSFLSGEMFRGSWARHYTSP